MLDTILVANRGEIACRIIKMIQQTGRRAIAIYSDADRNSQWRHLADDAINIGGTTPDSSYLQIDKIIDAAKKTNAKAIHPGYGFLSENTEFAARVIDAGIAWIGPKPDTIDAMGAKDAAKKRMMDAGVPQLPGLNDTNASIQTLQKKAEEIGYPVLVKAAYGGGGRGMRIVESADEFAQALESAKREAKKAFGNDAMLLEKYLRESRHVEVQIMGDLHGNVIHFGTRDCSIQRRQQKVIEEAPATDLPSELIQKIEQAAVDAAKAVDYQNAGTVEFLVADGAFYFLEMNTRLQVEHPVTELVTAQNLPALQIKVAEGEKLPAQSDIQIQGHAVEARLYAENPNQDFLPSTGLIERFSISTKTQNTHDIARFDTGFVQGDTITPYYDAMLGKVIYFAKDRASAFAGLENMVQSLSAEGIITNRDYLLHATHFAKDRVPTTQFVAQNPYAAKKAETTIQLAAAVFLKGGLSASFWSHGAHASRYQLLDTTTQTEYEITLQQNHTGMTAMIDGESYHISAEINDGLLQLNTQNMPSITVTCENQADHLIVRNVQTADWYRFEKLPLKTHDKSASTTDAIKAPMPGTVVKMLVKQNDTVEIGQTLAILEAMKMEHSLKAPHKGIVGECNASAGDAVSFNDIILTVTPN